MRRSAPRERERAGRSARAVGGDEGPVEPGGFGEHVTAQLRRARTGHVVLELELDAPILQAARSDRVAAQRARGEGGPQIGALLEQDQRSLDALTVDLPDAGPRSEEHTSELQSRLHLV